METKLFKALNETLAYATFKDADVEKQYKRLLIVADSDLTEAGFEESAAIEDAMDDLQIAINDADPIEEDDDADTNDDDENEEESEDDDEDEEEDEEIDEEDDDED